MSLGEASNTLALFAPLLDELTDHLGRRVTVNGWCVAVRSARDLRFVTIRDRTTTVQAVHRSRGTGDALTALIDALVPESAISVSGTVQRTVNPRFGPVEVQVDAVDVAAPALCPLPDEPEADGRSVRRHLELRSRRNGLVYEVQTTFESALREYLRAARFVEIHTPKITHGGSESGAAVFEVPYFGERACLVQSPQFYMQMAMAAGFDRAFEVGPVFRAEDAETNRHATEFTGIDVEVSWIDSHAELMTLEEDLLRHALSAVREVHGADIERHCAVHVEVPEQPIPRMTLQQAAREAGEPLGEGSRLTHRAEQALSRWALQRTGSSFVFVTDYPAADRPFYTMAETAPSGHGGQRLSRSFDLLWRGMEVTSGCQREHRGDRLRAQVEAAAVDTGYLETYYLPMFEHGCPPHGGFGIGLNRILMALLAQPSLRETSFVFRGPGRFVP